MPRRSPVGLADVASLNTLASAFWQASRGKGERADVRRFAADLDAELSCLRDDILSGRAPRGEWTSFQIRDPKPRRILAPCFHDRVLHHALMAHMTPVLERALAFDTYACRPGKGTLAAVLRAQQHARRFPWFVKVDVRAYFASIDHGILGAILRRRFKDPGLLGLCDRILSRTPDAPGVGLPIGALTSQHFANTYLDGLDRLLLETLGARAMVRYMDDAVWWCGSQDEARSTLELARAFVLRERGLVLKPGAYVGRSERGLSFLGFRVLPGTLRLLARRRRRYVAARAGWEAAYEAGLIDGRGLQAGYASALAITAHSDGAGWRRAQLARRPPLDA